MPSGLLKPIYHNVLRYTGDSGVSQDILRRRRLSLETMRRMGTPVLIKHMYTIEDVEKGIAEPSVGLDTVYQQPIHDDQLSYGIGYVSVEKTPRGEWIKPATETEPAELIIQEEPEPEWEAAPLYRGFGPGYLTYAILPDAPEDVYKLTEEGALIRTQIARLNLPWYPQVGDNDLLITCEIDSSEQILQTFERYYLKQVAPITMRGAAALQRDGLGRREQDTIDLTAGGNRHLVSQQAESSKIPETDPIYQVEWDR
jgi:hypothetical protein